MRIYLIGFMGSGKSHWGTRLAERLGVPFFDLDDVIVRQEGKAITEIFAENGEEYFRLLEKNVLESLSEVNEEVIISCGGGTPCFYGNIDYMREKGKVVWLNTDSNTLVARLLKEKMKRPLLRQIPDEELKAFIVKKLHDRKLYYEQAHITVPEDQLNLEQLIEAINHA
ncbi:shikimate kinase [Flavihumibacter rivuli]|uniref:shikimate kinase n=1 Tax=Flavihumibacter rivuli TaxID=2838156 RepID=UPI001BDDE4EB|nr:shikimate kinase [Flavihumibacter rivuli]ULQ56732.1 shikimate kinase [Flavihumibacter rivuli]